MTYSYLLDTNICIYIAKQKPVSVLKKFEQIEIGLVCMSIITHGELLYGAQKSNHPKKALSILQELTSLIPPLPLPIEAAYHYGKIRDQLENKGKNIGNNDLWIAAHAWALHLTVVTNDVNEFSRVPELHIENWVD